MASAIQPLDINKISHQPHYAGGSSAPEAEKPKAVMPVDRVTLSKQAMEDSRSNVASRKPTDQELTAEEQEAVQDLKQRDTEVKAHEQAHMSAGAGVVSGGASYQYQTGPDGKMYAVGGEVKIDLSTEGSPEATIQKMQQIQAAALAPAQPSGQDRAVAAQAAQVEVTARMEKTQQKDEEEAESSASPAVEATADAQNPPDPNAPNGSTIDLMA